MDTELDGEFSELLELLLEGNLDEPGQERLSALLASHPAYVAEIRRHLDVSSALALVGGKHDDFVRATSAHVLKVANEGKFEFVRKVKSRIRRQKMTKGLAIAAAVALAALFLSQARKSPAAEVATLVRMVDGTHGGTPVPVQAGSVFEEKTGLIRLDFKNGAVAAIEAPLKLTVVSGMEIVLESGRLNAWCPEPAHGFKVRTASALLTDLGTSFGISASPDGKSEFVVLDGLVEVEKGTDKRQLAKGDAVQAGKVDPLRAVEFSPSAFKNSWSFSNGIVSTRGAVIPANPDVPEKLSMMEDDDNVLVIPERRNILFARPIRAEITGPGKLSGNILTKISPEPKKRLSSFLIRYDPVGTLTEEHFLKFEGEVTFDRPVLAIATSRESLEQTDVAFALGEWKSQFRGLETSQRANPPDSVTLSEDRKTVKVTFYAGASTDEVRVILEDN